VPAAGIIDGRVNVRLAKRGDEAEVASMIAGFRDSYEEQNPSDEEIATAVSELIEDERTDFLLAGEPAVGFAQLRFRTSVWTGSEDAWLEDVFVVEQARGEGAGRALVEACIERARERGCKRIQLDTNESNETALSLYESLGFRNTVPQRFGEGRNLYFTLWL
jgi:ribosomal protein S18 acetylase RimI-like enzyme